jgi:hypothetical protein
VENASEGVRTSKAVTVEEDYRGARDRGGVRTMEEKERGRVRALCELRGQNKVYRNSMSIRDKLRGQGVMIFFSFYLMDSLSSQLIRTLFF